MSDNEKEVRFDKYCERCKYWDPNGKYNEIYDIVVSEEYAPCCYCLETAVRDETEVPQYWEEA